jgi:hypothetical protein
MKAMFLKELRENLKWGLLILGFFCLSVIGWIHEAGPQMLFDMSRLETTGVPIAIIGLALGCLQTWFETRPDNYAFTVHRPIARREIFLAKSAAGLLTIYVALALPAIYAVAWAATPGHLPTPFQWRSTLPLVVDILNAGPFYFVGMVLTMRKARWFGSRVLPFGLAAATIIAIRLVPEFWQAVLISVTGTAICGLAAWNVFSTAGGCDRSGVSRVALGAMIFAGTLGIGCIAVSLQSIFPYTAVWHDLRVDREGNVLRVTWNLTNKDRTCVVADAEGKPLPEFDGIDPDEKTDDGPDRFVRFTNGLVDEQRADIPWIYWSQYYSYRTPTPGMVGLRAIAKPGTRLRRHCVFDVQQGVIELYDPVTSTLLGTVGPQGYSPAGTLPEVRFPGAPMNPMTQGGTHTLAFLSAVYWAELDLRRVRKLFTAAADDPVVAAIELPPQTDPPVVVVTQRRVHLFHRSGEEVFSADHHLDLTQQWFTLAMLPNNNLMLRAGSIIDPGDKARQQFLEFDTDGKLVRQTEPAPFPDDRPSTVSRRTLVAGLFYPLAGLPVLDSRFLDYEFESAATDRWWLFHGAIFGAAIASGLATVFLARRCGFTWRKTFAWSVGNVLLGPGGVAVMLSLNDWPARETCSACGGKRLVDRQECSRCGKPLPPPVVDGREIFEPEGAFSSAA